MTGSMADTVGKINPYLYRGYYYDAETGLYYLNSRYYDPETGRFINADGAVSTGTGILGFNMFSYCNNNPVGMVDDGGSRPLAMSDTVESAEDQLIAAKINSEAHRRTAMGTSNNKVLQSLNNRKPGKTPNNHWPKLPPNLGGKKPKWNSDGYWEGANGGRYTWDSKSHGAGIDRGNGTQDGHWDDENSDNRWDKNGNLLFQNQPHSFQTKFLK